MTHETTILTTLKRCTVRLTIEVDEDDYRVTSIEALDGADLLDEVMADDGRVARFVDGWRAMGYRDPMDVAKERMEAGRAAL